MEVPGAVTDPGAVASSDVSIATSQGDLEGYLARPTGDRSRPGVIVVHEAFGLNDHVRDLARRFAAAGFDALAPNLYTRTGAPRADDRSDVFAKMFGLSDADVVADLEASAAHLRSLEGASGKVGCVGFCSGATRCQYQASEPAPWSNTQVAIASSSLRVQGVRRSRRRVRPELVALARARRAGRGPPRARLRRSRAGTGTRGRPRPPRRPPAAPGPGPGRRAGGTWRPRPPPAW